ncbi:DUF4312 family protein [Mangrovibacter sp. SLW1]
MKQLSTTTVTVQGKGVSKAAAFSDAFSHIQREVLKGTSLVLLRIEPQDVKVIAARQLVRKEAFLFFFLRRERRTFSVELEVTVTVTAIDPEQVDFIAQ